jgi:hypothetical protein
MAAPFPYPHVVALGPTISLWLLFGFATGIFLAIIALLAVIFSRDLKRGITTTINETVYEDLGEMKGVFLANLDKELVRRGVIPRKPLERGPDLIYRDFFNEVRIYAAPEDANLRFGFRSSSTKWAICLGVILLVPFVIGSVVIFYLAFLRRESTHAALMEAGTTAAMLCRQKTAGSLVRPTEPLQSR